MGMQADQAVAPWGMQWAPNASGSATRDRTAQLDKVERNKKGLRRLSAMSEEAESQRLEALTS